MTCTAASHQAQQSWAFSFGFVQRFAAKEIAIATTFTNGRVTLTDDLVFGVCVLSEDGYVPVSQLTLDDTKYVERLLNRSPSCPSKFTTALTSHRTALEATCV